MRPFHAVGLLTLVLALGCTDDPTVDLADLWLTTVTPVEDACGVESLVAAPWWTAEVERAGERTDWRFTPAVLNTAPPVVWHCPEEGGGLACWSAGLVPAEGLPQHVAWLDADKNGASLSGTIDVVSTPLSGLECTSSFDVEAERIDWNKQAEVAVEPSCDELSGATSQVAPTGSRHSLWVLNNSGAELHLDWIEPGGAAIAMLDMYPYGYAVIDANPGDVFQLLGPDGSCVARLQSSTEDVAVERRIVGNP